MTTDSSILHCARDSKKDSTLFLIVDGPGELDIIFSYFRSSIVRFQIVRQLNPPLELDELCKKGKQEKLKECFIVGMVMDFDSISTKEGNLVTICRHISFSRIENRTFILYEGWYDSKKREGEIYRRVEKIENLWEEGATATLASYAY